MPDDRSIKVLSLMSFAFREIRVSGMSPSSSTPARGLEHSFDSVTDLYCQGPLTLVGSKNPEAVTAYGVACVP